ncbi:AMP-binding protein [Streptomyces sp. NRRL F-5123]|uniref:AMP-binding protein n=1 Tax=Streptomyces sp. NRRL F-5123 TaxID=1463856 RepID=UPI0004E10BC3|nr:AMP-binding protein [Streptomyces sp. NRRL F-5123]
MSEQQTADPADRRVVLNGEGQHSIWWIDRELPAGWHAEGTTGPRERCLAHIQEVWTDLRPRSPHAGAERPRPAAAGEPWASGGPAVAGGPSAFGGPGAAGGPSAFGGPGAAAAPDAEPLPVRLARWARREPGAVAVEGDGFALTFGELDAASDRWARLLRSRGVGRGALVGVLLGRGADLHAVTLGAWKARAGCVPLDPDFPAARLRLLLADAGARVLVTELAHAADGLCGFDGTVLYVDDPEVTGAFAAPPADAAAEPPEPPEPQGPPDPDDVALVAHAPTVAGRPYPVAVTHRGLADHVAWAGRELTGARGGGTAVFCSVASEMTATGLWAPLAAGQRVVLAPRALDLAQLGEWLAAAGPFAFLHLTPSHLDLLVRQSGPAVVAALAGTFVVASGGSTPGPAAARLAEFLGRGRLLPAYGSVETSYGSCPDPVRPAADSRIRVLDGDGRQVPPGEVGELYVAGPGVALGYVGRAALTAERFLPDPYGPPGTRMFRTGQLVRRTAAGEAEPLGRTDRQVWIGGHRADPAEAEEALYDHPCVDEAVVVGVRAASGDVRLAAYVVPRPGAQGLDAAELAAHCRRLLPDHLVPASLALLAELPRAADGRVDLAALPRPGGPLLDAPRRAARSGRHVAFGGRPLAELLADCRVPGASVAVLDAGGLVAVEAAGHDGEGRPVTPRTAFPAGGLSRHVTALGVLRLADEGLLDLDAALNAPPDAAAGRGAARRPTLADLLGNRFGQAGADLLLALLEEVTGEPFGLLMRRLVLGPLGLDDSCFGGPPPRSGGRTGAPAARIGHDEAGRPLPPASAAAAGTQAEPDTGAGTAPGTEPATEPATDPGASELWTTASDLAKVALEVRRSAHGVPLALLTPDTAARMLTPSPDDLYGLGTMVDVLGSDTEFGHEGAPAGHYAVSTLRLRTGNGLVVLANGRAGGLLRREIALRLRAGGRLTERSRPSGDGKLWFLEEAQGTGWLTGT